MEITVNDDGSFTVKLEAEELAELKEVRELMNLSTDEFKTLSLAETLEEVITAGIIWLT
jgi:hypothetical protein